MIGGKNKSHCSRKNIEHESKMSNLSMLLKNGMTKSNQEDDNLFERKNN